MIEILPYNLCKSLSEKGFPQHFTERFYASGEGVWFEDIFEEEPDYKSGELIPVMYGVPSYGTELSAPNAYEVFDWLRNYKNIDVCIDVSPTHSTNTKRCYYWTIRYNSDGEDMEHIESKENFILYNDAEVDSINYILNNLI